MITVTWLHRSTEWMKSNHEEVRKPTRFSYLGVDWAVSRGLPPKATHTIRVDGYSHAEILGVMAPYPGSCAKRRFSDFLSRMEARNHAQIMAEIRDQPSLFLVVWDEVKGDFEPEYVAGHPEWGEVSL